MAADDVKRKCVGLTLLALVKLKRVALGWTGQIDGLNSKRKREAIYDGAL
jgi:hypothetical protein